MTTIPGTNFTNEQLYLDLNIEKSQLKNLNSDRFNEFGIIYYRKKQYDRALAWYIKSAMESNSFAESNIGELYHKGFGVPVNYLCALKWYLKSAKENNCKSCLQNIGELFEFGHGVPLDKYRALEWYRRYRKGSIFASIRGGTGAANKLKMDGYTLSNETKNKSLKQLINETESILETEKKKLEEIERRGQEKLKVLEQLKITYKLTQGGKDAWKNVPILIEEKQHRSKSIHGSIVTIEDERIKLKIRIRHLEEEKKGLETRIEQLEPLESEKTNLKLIINDKDKEIKSLQDDITVHQSEKRKLKSQIKQKNVKIDTLDDEITELNVKTSQLNLQVQDKDKKIKSVQTDNRKLKKEKAALGQELKEKGKRISSIENEKAILHTAAIKQAQKLETLHHEKTSLEMVLKSKVDALTVLNGENKNLSAANQIINGLLGSKQNELESQTSQAESVKQNLEQQLANEKRKNEALEREMRLLREAQIESAFYNSVSQPVESTYYDDVSQNDINYDTEFGEESDDDNTPPVDIAPVVRRWPIWIKQINE